MENHINLFLNKDEKIQLLSPRIYKGILSQESFLILNFKPLEKDIARYIEENNLNISVYILNLRDSASLGINENKPYEPSSLNKLPIAMIILKKIEEGKLSLDTILPINNNERDSSSGFLYKEPINQISIRDLLYNMLSLSDNTALWVLGKRVTLRELQNLSLYLDYYQKDINYLKDENNKYEITAKSTANLFISLYLSTFLKKDDSEMILFLLTKSSFDIRKYSNIPKEIIIAQKYGVYNKDNIKEFHNCGILYYKEKRFFYCILTRDLEKEKASEAVGNIVNKLYNFILKTQNINDINDLSKKEI